MSNGSSGSSFIPDTLRLSAYQPNATARKVVQLLPGFSTVDANGQSRPFGTSVVGGTNAPPVVSGDSVVVTTRSDYELGASGNLLATYDDGALQASRYETGYGYITASGARFYYHRDHLGNIRAVSNASGNTVRWTDYFAYGAIRDEWNIGQTRDNYGYTGKELDRETGLNDFGARHFDALIGIWNTQDPLWAKYPALSPYTYGAQNPFKFIDVDGKDIFVVLSGWAKWDGGKPLRSGVEYALLNEINQWAASVGLQNYQSAGYASSLDQGRFWQHQEEIYDALNFIRRNYREGEKVVIYGYSYGGANSSRLIQLLKKEGIPVHLLITVDASKGLWNDETDREIDDNVNENINYYQENPESGTGSRGGENRHASGKSDRVRNIKVENTSHGDIPQKVMPNVINDIKNALRPQKTGQNQRNKNEQFWNDMLGKASQAGEGRTVLYRAQ